MTVSGDPDMVIYHGGCWDGFASAMVARRAVVMGSLGDKVPELVPAHYGMPLPDGIDGRNVTVCDFSFPPNDMLELAERADVTVWLDHHKTAIEAMHPHEAEFVARGGKLDVDLERSGARITYDWFHPDAAGPPSLIRYIEDRDLWRKSLPNHEAVTMWIRSHEMTLEAWQEMADVPLAHIVLEGAAMAIYHQRLVCNAASAGMFALIEGAGVELPLAACSYDLGSDVAQRLIEVTGYPVAGYVLHNGHGSVQYGLRSRAGFDCSEIASRFGGGGHAQAAGFTSDRPVHVWLEAVHGDGTLQ